MATVTRSLFHLRASCEVTQIFSSVIIRFYLCKFICWIRVSSFIIKSVPSAGFKFPHHMLNTGPGVASKLFLQCHKSDWYSTCQPHVSDGVRDDCAQWSSNWRKKKRSCFGLKFDMKCWSVVSHICALEHIIGSTNTFWGSMMQFVDKNHPVTCVSREQHPVINLKNTIMWLWNWYNNNTIRLWVLQR